MIEWRIDDDEEGIKYTILVTMSLSKIYGSDSNAASLHARYWRAVIESWSLSSIKYE